MKIQIEEKEFLKFYKECKRNSQEARPILEKGLSEIAARVLRRAKQKTPVGESREGMLSKRDKDGNLQYYQRGIRKGQLKTRLGIVHQGGNLRRSWDATNLIKREGRSLIMVYNTARYGMYVEYGHRQTPGRFVPILGKRLKKRWVKGRFMLTKSLEEVDKQVIPIMRKHMKEAWKGWK